MINNEGYRDGNYMRMGDEILVKWPHFEVYDANTDERLDRSTELVRVLKMEDSESKMWCLSIPTGIYNAMMRYSPEDRSQVLALAKIDRVQFLLWTSWCPALVTAVARYQELQDDGSIDWFLTELERTRALVHGWKYAMRLVGLSDLPQVISAMRKIPANEPGEVAFSFFKVLAADEAKLAFMQRWPRFTVDALLTMQLPWTILGTNLLKLDEAKLLHGDVNSVKDACLEIADIREQLDLRPVWPFIEKPVDEDALLEELLRLRMEEKVALGHLMNTTWPDPPIPGMKSDEVVICPIQSIHELCVEGRQMQNCITTMLFSILWENSYAYRMERPARATIYIERGSNGWRLSDMRSKEGRVPPDRLLRIVKDWLIGNGGCNDAGL